MALDTTQISLLTLIALLGVPAGFLIAKFTLEELKPGKKWFQLIAWVSLTSFVLGPVFLEEGILALTLTISAFIFFLSAVPLFILRRKKNARRK